MSYAEGWRGLHPEWSYILWTDCPRGFEVEPMFVDAAVIVPERNIGQFKSDLLRYEILYRFGGVYVDCDMEPRKPIDDLMGPECWAAWEKQDVWVNNAVMGAAAKSTFLRRVLDWLPRSVKTTASGRKRPNIISGPHLVTRLHKDDPSDLTVYDQGTFYPYSWDEPERANEDFPEAYAIHRWANKTGLAH